MAYYLKCDDNLDSAILYVDIAGLNYFVISRKLKRY